MTNDERTVGHLDLRLSPRAHAILRQLAPDFDLTHYARIIETALAKVFTRRFGQHRTQGDAVALAERLAKAFVALPVQAWVDEDGETFHAAALAYEAGDLARLVSDMLEVRAGNRRPE